MTMAPNTAPIIICFALSVVVPLAAGDVLRSSTANLNDNDHRNLAYPCFQTAEELRQAVHDYMDSDKSDTSEVAGRYGFPIGTWCVDELEDMSSIFYGMKDFNEDISGWNPVK